MATALSPRHLFPSPPLKFRSLENKMLVGGDRGRQPFFVTQTRSGCLSWCGGASAAASKTAAAAVAGAHDADNGTLDIKRSLYASLEGIDRGIFGATSEKKSEIEAFVDQLESRNPTSNPTDNLSMVDGCWKLIYSTISILGSKRTKLGLRGFISLGDFLQKIDVAQGKAINEIKFNVRGLTMLSGQLIVTASFKISSKSRVDINFESSSISPDELLSIFQKNYNLLLAIFNPDGWLEITYVDESFRIGRDNKGNIFILEKVPSS